MSENCKYCELPENKQKHPGLVCESCNKFVHLACLRRVGTPGDFTCDVFFDFTCETCSPTNKELFVRNKFPWVNAIVLTLHHLNTKSYGISNHGYFHYKTHICSFIDRNWHLLFGSQFKQKKNWVGTIAGALSIYSGLFFRSGSVALGESGWWSLMHFFSPAVAAHIVQELAKTKGRPRNQTSLDRYHFLDKAIELGYKDLINEEVATPVQNPPQTKKRKLEWSIADAGYCDSFYPTEAAEELSLELRDVGAGVAGAEGAGRGGAGQGGAGSLFPLAAGSAADPALHTQSDSSSIHSYQQSALYYDSDSYSRSPRSPRSPRAPPDARDPPPDARDPPTDPPTDPPPDDTDNKATDKKDKNKRPKDKPVVKRDSLFSSELNSVDLPWVEKTEEEPTDLVEMTPYEEIQLLKQVESLVRKVRDPAKRTYLIRLRAKLALRRLKRHKHLPLFDLDKTVRQLAGAAGAGRRPAAGGERVLDRFQRSYLLDSLCGTIQSSTLGVQLLPALEPTAARSPHSGVLLKPFIRRDRDTTPPWLTLMDQLLRRTNRHIKDYTPPPRACIEYSYVKPQHIPAVNNLCAQYFWPGIDLSEALQYPEFSCVVTYKKLVIGCAFLVPDVAPNASYVSFLLTRPEWRRAKLASFMLYHLLQTCTGKDVTLHVSPTNPAIFLYQKFGFKVEELIQDFYEKYFDIDYKGCRHALFLRLVR